MGWLERIFPGTKKPEAAPTPEVVASATTTTGESIPPAKVGLNGEFDESGLAKRVAKALDDANISDSVGLWVAQTGSTVVLKYNPDAEGVLAQAKQVAQGVHGATAVTTQPNS